MKNKISGVDAVIESVWQRYEGNMAAGRMRQRPGRSEYQYALQQAGLLPKTEDAARQFFFDYNRTTAIGKAIARVEFRHGGAR